MKKIFSMLLTVLLVVLASDISAADLKGKFALTGKGGAAIPFGDFGGEYGIADRLGAKTGFGFCGSGEYFFTNNISIGAGVVFDTHSMNTDAAAADLFWKVINYGIFFKYTFSTNSKTLPYLIFDVGLYTPKLSVSVEGVKITATFSSELGIAGGAGLSYQLSPSFLLSAELTFHNAFTKNAKYQDLKLGSDIQYMNIFVGVTFLFGRTKQ